MFGFGKKRAPLPTGATVGAAPATTSQYPEYNILKSVSPPQMLMPGSIWYSPRYMSVAYPYGYAALQGVYRDGDGYNAYFYPRVDAPPQPHSTPGQTIQDKKGAAAPSAGNADNEFVGYRAPRFNEIVRTA